MTRVIWFFLLSLFMSAGAKAAAWPVSMAVGDGMGVQVSMRYATLETAEKIKKTGFRYVRLGTCWECIEKEKGVDDWRDLDRAVEAFRSARLNIILVSTGGNEIYTGYVPVPLPNADHTNERTRAPVLPEDIDRYARFMARLVARYQADDIIFEYWNEPDWARFWPPSPDAERYAALASVTCAKMRDVAPSAVIFGPTLGRVPDKADRVDPRFVQTFLKSSAVNCIDAFSLHPYRHGHEVPEAAYNDYRTMRQLIRFEKPNLPMVSGEWGYTGLQVPEMLRGAYVVRTHLLNLLYSVPLTIWYEWQDSRRGADDIEAHFGLLTYEGLPKPAYHAIESALRKMSGARLIKRMKTDSLLDYVLLAQKDGRYHLIFWTTREQADHLSMRIRSQSGWGDYAMTPMPEISAAADDLPVFEIK